MCWDFRFCSPTGRRRYQVYNSFFCRLLKLKVFLFCLNIHIEADTFLSSVATTGVKNITISIGVVFNNRKMGNMLRYIIFVYRFLYVGNTCTCETEVICWTWKYLVAETSQSESLLIGDYHFSRYIHTPLMP